MLYFMDTTEKIKSGVGFTQFGGLHLAWLLAFILITVACCFWYKN